MPEKDEENPGEDSGLKVSDFTDFVNELTESNSEEPLHQIIAQRRLENFEQFRDEIDADFVATLARLDNVKARIMAKIDDTFDVGGQLIKNKAAFLECLKQEHQ